MANVLETICNDKRAEIETLKHQKPLSTFIDQLDVSEKSMLDALKAPNAGFILECKKASPSKGLIREHFDLDEIYSAYKDFAAAISVLTDKKYFQGEFAYLEKITSMAKQPVLNKDFFVDEYQVYLARYYNADAVLLMLSVLTDDEYRSLHAIADKYQLDVLTEVSNEEETHRALALGAKIIGINNRNLRDLSTDLATTERLVPIIKADNHFDGVIISESGIYNRQQIERLNPLVDGYLVGSSIMAQDDLTQALRDLVYGQIKVCGVTSIDQAKLIAKFPVHYMGLIMVPDSKRYVALETAQEIVRALPTCQYVGVFQNQPIEIIVSAVQKLNLAAVQLHGAESTDYIACLRKALPTTCKIFDVQSVDVSANEITLKHANDHVHLTLLDSKVGHQEGGTGKTFAWTLLDDTTSEFGLAGGISIDNISDAIKTPAVLLDVNSGVETSPGQKSEQKLTELFAALRA